MFFAQTFDPYSSVNSFNQVMENLSGILWAESSAVCFGLMGVLSMLWFTWFGIKFADGTANFFGGMMEYIGACIIVFILVLNPTAQRIIHSSLPAFDKAGQSVGNNILQIAPSTGNGKNPSGHPVEYWKEWVVVPGENGKGDKSRFAMTYILEKMWGYKSFDTTVEEIFKKAQRFEGQGWIARQYQMAKGILEGLSFKLLLGLFLLFGGLGFFFFTIVSAILALVAILLSVLFTFVAVYYGSLTAFYFTLGLGPMILPAMLFKQYRNIWYTYLVFLFSIPLVIFFYHVLSAIGYVISDSIFEFLFVSSTGDANGFLVYLKEAFLGGEAGLNPDVTESTAAGNSAGGTETSNSTSPLLALFIPEALNSFLSKMADSSVVGFLLSFVVMGTLWLVGIAIVSSVMLLGIGMGALAPTIAFSWNNAFTSTEILQYVNSKLLNLQGTLASGMGRAGSQVVQKSTQAGGYLGKAGGSITKWGGSLLGGK